MNVLVCIPCLLTGGTEIQTLSLVKALIGAGHHVTTVCYFEHTQEMVDRYKDAGSNVVLLSPDGYRPHGAIKQAFFLFEGLKSVVAHLKPDIAHVQYMAPGAIPIILLRLLGVRKIIATAHTSGDIYTSLRLLHFIVRHCLTAFTCISLRAEESFFGHAQLFNDSTPLKEKENHFTIYNCLPENINIRETEKSFSDPVTLGVVSRLELIKGMDLVIEAFAKVHEIHSNTRLMIVGDGSLRDLMQEQTRRNHLDDVILFAGRQPQEKLQDYYDKMDILLMPSRSEGFGLTAIEGMARGCVVVASNVGGLQEIVSPETGLLCQPESVKELTEKILVLMSNKEQIHHMSVNASEYAKEFSFSTFQHVIDGLYKRIRQKT